MTKIISNSKSIFQNVTKYFSDKKTISYMSSPKSLLLFIQLAWCSQIYVETYVTSTAPTLTTKLNRDNVWSGTDEIQIQKSAEKLEFLALALSIENE
jgi:hypothetical protein